jgi:hypothetical protein
MRRRWLQLGRRRRLTLYATSLVLLISGAAWAWIHRLDHDGQASHALRELNPRLIAAHGFAALGFVLLLGTFLPGHVRRAWHAHKNRTNGAFFLTAVSVLTLSGYLLYYLGDERWRDATSKLHLWLGLAMPVLLFWHIRTGRKATGETGRKS